MADRMTPGQRSRVMSRIRSRHTGPEVAVRRMLHSAGYRFRLHAKDLPGRPDIIFRSRRAAVLVHGCFWHGHGCKRAHSPSSNTGYWGPKLQRNIDRDRAAQEALAQLGWRVLVVWECEVPEAEVLMDRLRAFVGPPGRVS